MLFFLAFMKEIGLVDKDYVNIGIFSGRRIEKFPILNCNEIVLERENYD